VNSIDFQRVFQCIPGLFLVLLPDGKFTIAAVSEAYLHTTRTEREKIIGHSIFEVFRGSPGDTHAAATMANLQQSLAKVLATRAPDTMVIQRYDLLTSEGSLEERFWSPVNAPVLSAANEILYIIHRVEDATELVLVSRREQAERAKLVESINSFQAVYDQGLFAGKLDLQGTVIDLNRSCLEQCGYVRAEMMGKPFWECGWWNRSHDVQAWVKAGVEQAIRGEPFRGESIYYWADGTERVVDFACMPIKDETGRTLFVFPTGMDITERIRAEKNLRAADILESITEGFFALDRDWRFTYVNREGANVLNRGQHDFTGKVIWDEYPGLADHEVASIYRMAMDEGRTGSLTSYYPDHNRWYEIRTYPAPAGISVYFRDVTAQKRAELEQQRLAAESERQRRIYEAALSNTPDLVYVFGLDHRFTYANEALLKMWGKSREQALGRNCLELGYEPWHAEMHSREIEEVKLTRKAIRGEVPFTGTNGRRIYDYILVPVLGPEGDVVAVAGTTRDITDRQQAEQEIREQAARLAESDRAKDEFLATLSHELRNPLAPLRNSLALLRMERNKNAADAPVHEMMERQVNHLVRLVDDLLETSRISRGTLVLRKELVEIAAIVRNAVETVAPLIQAAGHHFTVTMPDDPVWVEGDPVRLAQIVANLLDNAAKYTDDGGRISVDARQVDGFVKISVRDNGTGIAAAMLPQMFEMFSRGERTTRRGQGGLGIGLALARRLAVMHGGNLEAFSEGCGKGSEFTVRLALAGNQKLQAATAEPVAATIARQRILVVDDNRDAADSLGTLLELLGAEVRVARDGPEGIEIFATYDPAVVLLDIGMPGMDGYQVARTLRARFPARRPVIVALTGWGQDQDRRRAHEAGFDHHLVKPAEIGALQKLLVSVDERPHASR
jgi:PAS domain S-box-containing protein